MHDVLGQESIKKIWVNLSCKGEKLPLGLEFVYWGWPSVEKGKKSLGVTIFHAF